MAALAASGGSWCLGSVRPFRISLKIALAFALVLALPSVVIGYQISGHRNDDQAPALVRSSQTDSPLLLVYSDGSAAIPASGAAGNTQVFPEGTYSFDPTTNSTGYRLHASSDVASLSLSLHWPAMGCASLVCHGPTVEMGFMCLTRSTAR
jgi:hypothetical protein